MKKNLRNALFGATALLFGAISFSACSSSDDVIDKPNYNPETNTVKTQFAISLPSNVNAPQTRMLADIVQQADNSFRGMTDVTLIPFDAKPTAATATALGSAITPGDIAASGALTNFTGTTGNYKVYDDVDVPATTAAFLFYAQAIGSTNGTDFSDGKTEMNNPTTSGTAGYTFSPVAIYDGSTNSKGVAIATYLTQIANATGWSSATDAKTLGLYTNFIAMKAGSTNAVKSAVTRLWNEVKDGTDAISTAITAAITNNTYVTVSGTDLTFDSSIDGYPANLNLPDGAAAVTWNSSSNEFEVDDNGNTVGKLESYVYPASLWYRANTTIKVSNAKQTDNNGNYPSAKTSWADATNGVLTLYTDGASVGATTRSIALEDVIQYAVGRFDVTAKCADGTLYDYKGKEVTVHADGFPVTAVLIGGQKPVDFQFTNPSGTNEYTIYDKTVSSVYAKDNATEGTNYTLVLETAPDADVNVAVEFTNNTGNDFYGLNGQIIPAGGKFYLTATLTAASATETGKKIFMQDYYTTANFTINKGTTPATPDDSYVNNAGLGTATNTIPDLRTPQIELGMSVDLNWQAGHTYDVGI